ncbi:DUF4352 domain-containing protein [Cellulomonas hominis]|uniref:DUF4352 domain-containing protein n=1 Tax=Cellulomonas hominis TaxID=156981 RepID=UPI001C1080F8|nr:DUF4352 domain-containing protein [Cellulomonas hominis]MBU5421488.1 DUF4352 domain-containing protein [Cellulomonas hominis]
MSQVPPPPAQPYPAAPGPGTPGPVPGPPPRRSWFARHKVLTTLGALVVLVVVVGIATSGGSDDPATPEAAPAAPAAPVDTAGADEGAAEGAAEEPVEAPAAPGIGTAVQDGKFEFTVTSVEPGVARVGNDVLGQDAQGQYVLVHLTVTNVGTEAQYFYDGSQKAFDAQDREFSADSTAAVYLGDGSTFLDQINPGNTVSGTVVFDVPADTTLTRLELHDSPFSGGVEVALG